MIEIKHNNRNLLTKKTLTVLFVMCMFVTHTLGQSGNTQNSWIDL